MSSVLDNQAIHTSALRLSADQYRQLCESGVVSERTELLHGIVVRKMGKSPLHTWTVEFLAEWFRKHAPTGTHVRIEQPLALGDSEPEPNLAIVAGQRDDYRSQHPSTASLIVEVAISTEEVDREKASICATVGVAEYWIVLPKRREVIVYRNPGDVTYDEHAVLSHTAQLPFAGASLPCSQLFPE